MTLKGPLEHGSVERVKNREQACETQTTSRAAKALKLPKGLQKHLKILYMGHIIQHYVIENDFTYGLQL